MKKFIAIYYSTAESMAQMAQATPEQKAEGMKPWMAWKDRIGDALVDMGAPLMPGQGIRQGSDWENLNSELSGYSIVQAKDLEAAKALFDGHPHISWAPGSMVAVHEFAAM